jgi:hypothetical protein
MSRRRFDVPAALHHFTFQSTWHGAEPTTPPRTILQSMSELSFSWFLLVCRNLASPGKFFIGIVKLQHNGRMKAATCQFAFDGRIAIPLSLLILLAGNSPTAKFETLF